MDPHLWVLILPRTGRTCWPCASENRTRKNMQPLISLWTKSSQYTNCQLIETFLIPILQYPVPATQSFQEFFVLQEFQHVWSHSAKWLYEQRRKVSAGFCRLGLIKRKPKAWQKIGFTIYQKSEFRETFSFLHTHQHPFVPLHRPLPVDQQNSLLHWKHVGTAGSAPCPAVG